MRQHDSKDCQQTNCKGVHYLPSERLVFHKEEYTYGHLVSVSNGIDPSWQRVHRRVMRY
jgi:hypothetical protein